MDHYYCVIDFEATCERDRKIKNQEIIEFPAVFVNAATLTADFEFHSYVKPIFNPKLTPFCKELTGIGQQDVDNAPMFGDVLNDFCLFAHHHGFDLQHNWSHEPEQVSTIQRKTLTFVTHGDWDLKTMLPSQCRLSHVRIPKLMRSWINIKNPFSQLFPDERQRGMARVLETLRLDLIGRHHSGIDDSRNIARILIELVRRGVDVESFRQMERRH